jgi:hypothetical protein
LRNLSAGLGRLWRGIARSPAASTALRLALVGSTAWVMVFGSSPAVTRASSHREAPMISQDPAADATDLYAFVSPDAASTVTFVANYWPMCEPAGGPNFCQWDPNAQYDINIDNNGDAVADIVYRFNFQTTIANGATFLNNVGAITSLTDADLNVRQTYTITKIGGNTGGSTSTTLASGVQTAPHLNPGARSFPDGYEAVAMQAIRDLGAEGKVFVGPRDDPFFVDLGAIFDLLAIRRGVGNQGGGVDNVNGFNVLSIALQVPNTRLTRTGAAPTGTSDTNAIIGVWTTSSRQSTRVLSAGAQTHSGSFVQISRLGQPLVNEVVIPLSTKDAFNNLRPDQDAGALSAQDGSIPLLQDPELARLFNALYGINVPPTTRTDLIDVFLRGVSGLNRPSNVTPSEMLRLNMAIPPSATPNRLGVIAGDNAGFPNGRRLSDDVVDIAERVVAGVLVDGFNVAPNNQLGDGTDGNDAAFKTTFPYLAPPWSGFSSPHGTSAVGGSPVVPELPVQLMFGSGLAGLGGYALLQARRMRQRLGR